MNPNEQNKYRIGWIAIFFTVVLLAVLKKLHVGVLHYNLFLFILFGWTAALIVLMRKLSRRDTDEPV
jgi:hypothetical protein